MKYLRWIMNRFGRTMLFMLAMSPAVAAAQGFTCDTAFVYGSLQWCAGDHGFNEGAVCGLSALSGAGLSGLPVMAALPVLGNTWDRTNMIGAARVAARAGQTDAGANAAICCQIHNPPAHDCLASRKQDVVNWLSH